LPEINSAVQSGDASLNALVTPVIKQLLDKVNAQLAKLIEQLMGQEGLKEILQTLLPSIKSIGNSLGGLLVGTFKLLDSYPIEDSKLTALVPEIELCLSSIIVDITQALRRYLDSMPIASLIEAGALDVLLGLVQVLNSQTNITLQKFDSCINNVTTTLLPQGS